LSVKTATVAKYIGAGAQTVVLVLLSGCASNELVRADEMSAAQHRAEAQRETDAATRAASRFKPPATPSGPTTTADDANEEYRRAAESRREHARQHAAAAQFLEEFEDQACRHVPAGGRGACPLLGPVVRLEDVPGGIRAMFADPKRVPAAINEMRCHYAYARSHHFDEAIGCPLYVSGIEIRQALDPSAIEIVSRDPSTVRHIRERSREQAVFVGL
jgi:hypothetical protein